MALVHDVAASESGVFGGAISVDKRGAWRGVQEKANAMGRANVAASKELAQGCQIVHSLLDHEMKKSGGEPKGRHLMPANGGAEVIERGSVRRHDHQTASVEQSSPNFEGRGVKGNRRELKEDLVGSETAVVGVANEANDSAILNQHTFGSSGRARGVHHVGQAGGSAGWRRVLRVCRRERGIILVNVNGQEFRFAAGQSCHRAASED
jgi:hypothetical protein